jgi:cytochrome c oxidase subunit II
LPSAAIHIRSARLAWTGPLAFAGAALALAFAASPVLGGPSGSSQGGVTDPASPVGREISSLFWGVTLFAFIVGILVETLLVYTLLKFRADRTEPEKDSGKEADGDATNERDAKDSPKDSGKAATTFHPKEHGNRKVEVGILIVTAVGFAILVLVSWTTLFAIETPPEGPSMTIQATGHQWAWEFRYPDEAPPVTEFETVSEMHVPVNMIVKLDVTSTDVNHAVWIPDLGVKIDAVPGHINHFWFNAEREGRYLLQCAEFCGGAHSEMHATVVAEPQADYEAWVAAKHAAANPPPPPLSDGTRVNVTLSEYTIYSERPLFNIDAGANITFHIWNNGTMNHSFALGAPYNLALASELAPGASIDWSVVFDQTAQNATYSCPVGGHAALGMTGTFNVTQGARVVDIYLHDAGVAGDSYRIVPSSVELTPGENVQFRAHNNGSMTHNLKVGEPYAGIVTRMLAPGESALTPAFVVGQSTQYWCDVPGHRQLGMEGNLKGQGAAQSNQPNVPGFEGAWVGPALALAAVAVLWRRDRVKPN